MKPQLAIQILSKKLIKPATPTPHNFRKFKISSLDQRQPPIHISYVFFYPANDKDEAAKNELRSKELQISLSEVLTLFYPLAGRYFQDDLLIECNDDGAEYVEAEIASHLTPFLRRDLDNKQLIPFVPQLQSESSTSPLVAVQCNMFECGGLAIGLCISHRILDAFTFSKFIDGWATACRVGTDKVRRPRFDLAAFLPTREMKPASPLIAGENVASKTFVFSGLAISNLREIAKAGDVKDSMELGSVSQASRVQLVTALIWKALIRLAQVKNGDLKPSIVTHMINMRGRTVLPMLDDCCGNLPRLVIIRFTPEKKSNKVEFHELLSLVCDTINNAVIDCAKPQNGDELFLMVYKAWGDLQDLEESAKECNRDDDHQVQPYYFFTSLCRMPIYPDFGWGKPTRATRVNTSSEFIIELRDTRDGVGIEALICLHENEMNLFLQDPDIRAFTSQVEQHGGPSTYFRSRY